MALFLPMGLLGAVVMERARDARWCRNAWPQSLSSFWRARCWIPLDVVEVAVRGDEPRNGFDRGDGHFRDPDAYHYGDSDRAVIGSGGDAEPLPGSAFFIARAERARQRHWR